MSKKSEWTIKMTATCHLLVWTFLLTIIIPFSNCKHVVQIIEETTDTTPSFIVKEADHKVVVDDDVDKAASSLRALSLVWGTFGSQFIPRIPDVEDKITKMYIIELGAKSDECHWTDRDRKKWERKRRDIKLAVEGGTPLEDHFGLNEFRNMDNLKKTAKSTLAILEDMENLTKSMTLGAHSNMVVVKFTGYLRERMMLRQRREPYCTWTEQDGKRAGKKIVKIVEQLATEVVNGLSEHLEKRLGNIFSQSDKDSLKKQFYALQQVYGTLFEPFEHDDY